MTDNKQKYKQSDTVLINRSQINFAPYNPKNHSKESINDIKRNFKNVAFLGGIVWNETTRNLIDGHKRIMAMDIIHKYDGTPETDYKIKVEKIALDLKTEKEQNIFQSASRSQFDDELMRQLIPEIDYKNAGLDDFDLNYFGVSIPEIENDTIVDEIEEMYAPVKEEKELTAEAKKEAVKQAKQEIKEKSIEKAKDMVSYITLSFKNHQAKEAFCKRFDLDQNSTIIQGESFSDLVERIY